MPYRERRERLAALLAGAPTTVRLSPTTTEADQARRWLHAAAGYGIDGVVVKDPDAPYAPGRRSTTKVKPVLTADCVLAGMRLLARDAVSSLLLGLYDGGGALRHVGVVSSFPRTPRAELLAELAPLVTPLEGHPWQRGFGLEGGAIGRLKGSAGLDTADVAGLGSAAPRARLRGRLRPGRRPPLAPSRALRPVASQP